MQDEVGFCGFRPIHDLHRTIISTPPALWLVHQSSAMAFLGEVIKKLLSWECVQSQPQAYVYWMSRLMKAGAPLELVMIMEDFLNGVISKSTSSSGFFDQLVAFQGLSLIRCFAHSVTQSNLALFYAAESIQTVSMRLVDLAFRYLQTAFSPLSSSLEEQSIVVHALSEVSTILYSMQAMKSKPEWVEWLIQGYECMPGNEEKGMILGILQYLVEMDPTCMIE